MKKLFKPLILLSFFLSLPTVPMSLWNDAKNQCKKIVSCVSLEQQQLASDALMASGGIGLIASSSVLLFSLSLYASDLTKSPDRYVLENIRNLALKISIPSILTSGLLFKLGRKLDRRTYYWKTPSNYSISESN